MSIDWLSWAIQIVNFLVLVVLLKRFLYRPLLERMEAREKRIADRLTEAERREREAGAALEEHRALLAGVEARRLEMLAEARDGIEQWKAAALRDAKESVERQHAEWRRALEAEKGRFLRDLRERTGRRITEGVRRALESLADRDLEAQLASMFLERMETLDEADRQRLVAAARQNGGGLVVRSAFELPEALRDRIRSGLRDRLDGDLEVSFEILPDLVCGLEVVAADYRVAWNVAEYLDTLEQSFAAALEHDGQTA